MLDLGSSHGPAGSVRGTIRNREKKPLSGVTIQAFALDSKNNRESSPLRTTKTLSDGTYTLDPLPPGSYAIGVNGRTYDDEDAYRPTMRSDRRSVYVAESGALEGIDIVLPPARAAAQSQVTVLGPDGRSHSGPTLKLEDLQGVQRWFARHESDANGEIKVPAYVGEHYIVRGLYYLANVEFEGIALFEGAAQLEVKDQSPSITVVLHRQDITK